MSQNEVAVKKKTASERYTDMIMKEFSAVSGEVIPFDQNQKRLAQHLFVKADAALKTLETKRVSDNRNTMTPYTWDHINLSKLAVDSVHRIEIGLDALIPNHLSMIPYWNKRLEKYDLELQIGYAGKDYYRREMAFERPVDIIYELVHKSDIFTPIKKGQGNDIESYTFEIKSPFDRGEIIGGFGYIIYEDGRKNKLVIVTEKEFKESEALSKGGFWKKNPKPMRYKTIVNRTTDKVLIDPRKTGIGFFTVEQQEVESEFGGGDVDEEQIIDVDFDVIKESVSKESKSEPVSDDQQTEFQNTQERQPGDDEEDDLPEFMK